MQVPDWLPQYAGMTALTAIGSLMRAKQWVGPDGHFEWTKFVTEAATATGLAVVAIGAGTAWHVEPAAMGAICVGAGWLGPSAVSDFLLKRAGVKE